ncbi:hypothetical protein NE398_05670 [Clostridium tertium]|uniref:Uncharacterized protein n=1 Tax=Clostridium tertium TaxID=1559 RepID=A0A9X3XHF9_9CLOT|nr:hypothetical protein [Clostridium tertium]MDC4239650.1 hypothetical protein [Clostridium tertium]
MEIECKRIKDSLEENRKRIIELNKNRTIENLKRGIYGRTKNRKTT